jgi:hypothetical protein
MCRAAIQRLFAAAAVAIAVAAALAGCSQKSRCVTKGVDVEITGEPPHSAVVPAEDVERGAAHTYAVKGEGHQHLFVLKEEDMKKLQHGEPVQTRTTSSNAHGHEVTVRCKD